MPHLQRLFANVPGKKQMAALKMYGAENKNPRKRDNILTGGKNACVYESQLIVECTIYWLIHLATMCYKILLLFVIIKYDT